MFENQQLPSNLWPLRDAIIDYAHGNARKPRSLKKLHDWLEDDGWGSLVGEESEQEMVLNLYSLAQQKFSDSEFSAVEGLDPGDVITDEMRLTYARGLITEACAECDESLCPTIHSYKLERPDGASATVGASVESQQGGAVANWQGIFATLDDFFAEMKRCDVWLLEEAPDIDDARLLGLWTRDV
jgi:hypothetical protein